MVVTQKGGNEFRMFQKILQLTYILMKTSYRSNSTHTLSINYS